MIQEEIIKRLMDNYPKTKRLRVLVRLYVAKLNHEEYIAGIPRGFIPVYELQKPWVGGTSGDRRKRELQEKHNLPIECRKFKMPGRIIFAYKLGCCTRKIDIREIVKSWPRWKYSGSLSFTFAED